MEQKKKKVTRATNKNMYICDHLIYWFLTEYERKTYSYFIFNKIAVLRSGV